MFDFGGAVNRLDPDKNSVGNLVRGPLDNVVERPQRPGGMERRTK